VAEELRRRIVQGIYGPGSRIPSEADLVREFQVSAITVRRTVRDLQFEGLLVGRQGLGVFVTDKRRIRRSLSANVTTPLRDEMRRAGVEPGVKVIALRSRSILSRLARLAASELAALLRCASVAAVRSANDESVCVQFITTAETTISQAKTAASHRPLLPTFRAKNGPR